LGPLWLYVLCCVFLPVSCGIEDYTYLEPVEYVRSQGSTSANIIIPDNNSNQYFRYYAIFYRIYISDQSIDSITTSEQRRAINSALASHYSTLDRYAANDNISPSSVGTTFSSLKYYPLYVQIGTEYPMSQVLTSNPLPTLQPIAQNNTVDIVFANAGPYLKINYNLGDSGELPLQRSADQFTARPNRSFFNTTGTGNLTDENSISDNSNADVERNPAMTSGGSQHTYVSLYIVATGLDNNFTSVYSRPKHIGVFRLP
jgi:hypothetical protein